MAAEETEPDFDRFRELTKQLLNVSKEDLDEQRNKSALEPPQVGERPT